MNFYQRWVGDYMRDTAHLSVTEHGAYNLLLDHQYATGKPLPESLPALCRICRAVAEFEQVAVTTVAEQYFPVVDGGRWNPRARIEVERANVIIEAQRVAGAASANRRWARHGSTDRSTHRSTDGSTDGSTNRSTIHTPQPQPQPQPQPTPPPPPSHLATCDGGVSVIGARATRLRPDWTLPPPWAAWTRTDLRWAPDRIDTTAERFRDYWIAKAGKDGRKVDWFATWRNWCRNDTTRGNGSVSKQSRIEAHNAEVVRQILAEDKK